MINFINWLMQYIGERLNEDEDFINDFTITYVYDKEEEPKTPQISFMQLSDIADANTTTFQSEKVAIVGIQIEIFSQQMIIKNHSFIDDIATAQESALVISEKIRNIVSDIRNIRPNKDVLRVRRIGSQFSMPFSVGIYRAINRIEFTIREPYEN